MSLILEALRKSEAERRRGQSPDLFAGTPGVSAPRPERARVWPLLLLAAMLLASAWLIWRSGGESAGIAPEPTPQPHAAADAPRVIIVPAAPPPPPARAARTSPAPVASSTPAPPAPVPALSPPPASVDAPADPDLPPVAVLDAATRAALPPLKLTMHVYADDPARRFAIIDGQRVGEGARLGPGVVEQIRRDGVVVVVDGQRVLVAKP